MRGQLRTETITARDGSQLDVDLWMPDSYHDASPDDKDGICNGCGPQGWLAFFVSEEASGVPFAPACNIHVLEVGEHVGGVRVPFAPACNIHDWMYEFAEPFITHKEAADRVFQNNLVRLVRAFDRYDILGNFIDVEDQRLRDKRLQVAELYYLAVSKFGGDAFWANKGGHDVEVTSAPRNEDESR